MTSLQSDARFCVRMKKSSAFRWLSVFLFLTSSSLSASEPVNYEPVNYGRDIRPILSDRCFVCHGIDRDASQNDLRLDVREEAIDYAIIAGSPDESLLLERIMTEDKDLVMPPVHSGRKPVTEDEVALIRRWIEEGAQYTDHWAYTSPQSPTVPDVDEADSSLGQIDRFISSRLKEKGLKPAAEADRRTLARRLSFDLLGLPPSADQVEEFVADQSPEAYERYVDRLLASEHYGERMALHWLDLVRYADTNGYHGDNEIKVTPYRDYVINAFNNNKPFDQFTVEQLAGDLLPNPTLEQKVASGYNRLLLTTQEGGAQAKEYIAIYQADRVRNFSAVWLAATMGCCQCHDHKFDPISIRDFYSLGAFFADINEPAISAQVPNLLLLTPQEEQELSQIEQDLQKIRSESIPEELWNAWKQQIVQGFEERHQGSVPLRASEVKSNNGTILTVLDDHSVLSSGPNPATETYEIMVPAADLSGKKLTGIRLEVLKDPSFPNGGLSRGNGNFVLSQFRVDIKRGDKKRAVKLGSAVADFEQPFFSIQNTLLSNRLTGWAVSGHEHPNENREAIYQFEKPLEISKNEQTELIITLRHESSVPHHTIGRFRLSATTKPDPATTAQYHITPSVIELVQLGDTNLEAASKSQLQDLYRQYSASFEKQRNRIQRLENRRNQIHRQARSTLVTEALDQPRTVRVLPRGNWLDDSGEIVAPAIPVKLGALDVGDRRANRLDLARWLVQEDHPLTSRVFVNRIWTLFFGQGISRSLEDFGYQGDWPTHPELLDWLAIDFVQHDWDVKRLVKQIVMSRAYRQSCDASLETLKADPRNELVSRQNRFRFDAEIIRDNALATSGLLAPNIGGPSVKPYQPAGYWQHLNFPTREWQADTGANLYRRGLYTFWSRTFLHPSLLAFDATTREECVANRNRSNTPLQALVLLNDPTYTEAARVLAVKTQEAAVTDEDRINALFRQVLHRKATSEEHQILEALLNEERHRYEGNSSLAHAVAQNGAVKLSNPTTSAETAAWTAVSRTILNLHETITRE